MEQQIVVFELASERYGVDIAAVQSIIKLQPITALPHAPSFVEGITNLRGNILPVFDLRKRFGLTVKEYTNNNRIIVVSLNTTKVGMIVDAVSEVLRIPEEAIEPAPSMVVTFDSAFIDGIAKVDQTLIILLDLGIVFGEDERLEISQLEKISG
jgi:purine-binding chemotaxis protein CheW